LVMESLGKELDLDGNIVNQGLSVFGNKGGTDAHAFIQQLNDGRDDFFATFIEILADAQKIELGSNNTMGDYLHGFCAGLSAALRSKGRQTISIKLRKLTVFELGMIIALYERAVAIYAEFININAFHQPGVQAYKLAATGELELKVKLDTVLKELNSFKGSAADIAKAAGVSDQDAAVEGWLRRMAANGELKSEFDGKNWIYTIG
ncbi:MAG: glucose-6-phosphate isomerase, partial [Lentisphaeria bacterium]|nr:glucose-6-phosphate isomerase [Lentisphaeria bacterium]